MDEKKKIDVTIYISVAIGIFAVYLQIFPPQTPADQLKSMLYFLSIIGYIFLLYFVRWFSDKVKGYTKQIHKNTEDIQKIREEMNIDKKFNQMDKRLYLLEAIKNKNGYVDPKWILLVILLILFYLYLRSLGIFK